MTDDASRRSGLRCIEIRKRVRICTLRKGEHEITLEKRRACQEFCVWGR
jgi:hypothetical protein